MKTAKTNVRSATITAIRITADGRREDLGTVGYYHRNPLMRLWFRLTKLLGV